MSITGYPTTPPVKVGVAVSDLFTGLYSTVAGREFIHDELFVDSISLMHDHL